MARPSPEKLQLLAKLLAEKGIAARAPGIPKRRGSDAPLSYGQQRMWFVQQLEPSSSEYNDELVVRIEGRPVDPALLERCLQEVVRRHEVLRTSFPVEAGEPVQRVLSELHVPLRTVDLRAQSAAEQGAAEQSEALERLWLDEVRRPFVLDRPPLVRATLALLGGDVCELGLTMHHIVSDGVAYTIFFRELGELYAALERGSPSPLPPLPIQFGDYAQWERDTVTEAVIRQKLPFWQQYLGGDLQPLALPADRQRTGPPAHRGAFLRFRFEGALFAALQEYCRREQVTSNWVLVAAYFALWHVTSGQRDIAIGTPSSTRGRQELEPLIGFFVQTLVLRVDLGGNPTFRELIRRVQRVALEVSRHEEVPFDRIFQAVRPGVPAAEAPLIQGWIAPMKNLLTPLQLPGATSTYRIVDPQNARFDVSLILDETPQQLTGYWEYDVDLFDADTIAGLDAKYGSLLALVLRHPDTTLQLLRETLAPAAPAPRRREGAPRPLRKLPRRPPS